MSLFFHLLFGSTNIHQCQTYMSKIYTHIIIYSIPIQNNRMKPFFRMKDQNIFIFKVDRLKHNKFESSHIRIFLIEKIIRIS